MARKCRNFCINKETLSELEKIAKDQGKSVSELVEEILTNYVNTNVNVKVIQEGNTFGTLVIRVDYKTLNRIRQAASIFKTPIEDFIKSYFLTWLSTYIEAILHVNHEDA